MFLKVFRKPKPTTDAEYVQVYRNTGDVALLGELYGRNMELVFAICYKYLRDEEEAKDAVMQLFEQLVTDLKKHEVSNFKSWLHAVARNYCLMQLRSKRIEVSEEDFLINEEGEFVEKGTAVHLIEESSFELEDNLSKLEKCLETLIAEQKKSVELFYLKEKSYREISDLTGFDFNKVKSYIQNGKRNLKICMETTLL